MRNMASTAGQPLATMSVAQNPANPTMTSALPGVSRAYRLTAMLAAADNVLPDDLKSVPNDFSAK